uniref:F-box domain-containing protein n=1 Tax=Panagrellus redivivus TaxID=6233 RepID=A0A7E4UYF9_PANRE
MHSPKRRRIESPSEASRLHHEMDHLLKPILDEMVLYINDKNFTTLLKVGFASRHAFKYVYNLVKNVDSVYFHGNNVYFEFNYSYVEYNRKRHGEVLYKLALMNTPIIAGITVCELWLAELLAQRTKPLIFDVTDMFRETDVLRYPCVTGVRVENYNVRLAKIVRKFSSIQHVEMTIVGDVGYIPRVRSLIVNLRYVKHMPAAVVRNWLHESRYYDSYCVDSKNVPIIPTLPTDRVPLHFERNEALENQNHAQRRLQLYQKIPPAVKRLVIRDHYFNAVYERIGQPLLSLSHYYRFFARRIEYLELDLIFRCDCRAQYTVARTQNMLDNLFAFSKEYKQLEAKCKVKEYKLKVQYQYIMKSNLFDKFFAVRYLLGIKKQLMANGFIPINEDADSITYKISPRPYAECYLYMFRNCKRGGED